MDKLKKRDELLREIKTKLESMRPHEVEQEFNAVKHNLLKSDYIELIMDLIQDFDLEDLEDYF
jgi:hypothetical protein